MCCIWTTMPKEPYILWLQNDVYIRFNIRLIMKYSTTQDIKTITHFNNCGCSLSSFREYPKANDWLNLAWTVPIVMKLHYRCLIHFYCIRPVGIENTYDMRFFCTATFYILVNLWKNVSMETKQKKKYSWVCYHAVWYTIYSIQQGSELTRIWIYVLLWIDINSLAPGRFQQHFRWVIFMFILVIDDWCISCEIAIRYM